MVGAGCAPEPEAVALERVSGVGRRQHGGDPGRHHPGNVVVGGRHLVVVEPGGVDGGVAELVAGDQGPQEAGVRGQAEDRGVVERPDQGLPRGLAVGAVRDDLAEHRVVRRADDLARSRARGRPARPRRGHRTRLVVPACGRKPPKESSAYTRASMACPWMRQVLLREREGCAGGDPELLLDQVDAAADQLGDGVLDLEPGVHLQEVEVAGGAVEQELHGAGVGVADLARELDGRAGEAASEVGVDGRAGCLLEHLLVAPLRRAVALEEVDHVRRGCRPAPAPRRGARTRRTSRRAGCRRRRRCAPHARPRRSRRRTRRRSARPASPCRHRRPRP